MSRPFRIIWTSKNEPFCNSATIKPPGIILANKAEVIYNINLFAETSGIATTGNPAARPQTRT
jgi:hypothetical protein